MGARITPVDDAAREARRVIRSLCGELRDARRAAGLSLADAARAAGLSRSQLSRLERDELLAPTFEQVWRAAVPLGLRLSAKLYPSGSPVRDRAHLALLARFEALLGDPLRMTREVPLPIPGDLRAWDAMVSGDGSRAFVEAESRVPDMQALERRLRIKLRDDGREAVLILLVQRSEANRLVLRDHREALRDLLPLDGAAVIAALRSGRCPPSSGLLVR
jgi:transcriptional regulator with XRE-family HTH domain